jgi:glyoxylate reductase
VALLLVRATHPEGTLAITVTTLELPQAAKSLLQEAGEIRGPDHWQDFLPLADALIPLLTVRVDRALLASAPRLRVVSCATAGYEHVDLDACRERGIVVTHTPDVLTDATADLTLALLLATVRRLPQAERSLRAGQFQGWGFWDYLGGDLHERLLGIFGMGRIGRAVAQRAPAFGLRVQYHSPSPLPARLERALAAEWVTWDTLLETSDILSLHAPLTPRTHHVLDQQALRRMRRGSYLINTARGALVDETALVQVLRDGHLAGAGLDVYEREPDIAAGLLELDNAVLLPHIGSATRDTRTGMAMLAARNAHAVLCGQVPPTPAA